MGTTFTQCHSCQGAGFAAETMPLCSGPLTIRVGFRALFLKLGSSHGPPYLKICSISPLFMKQIQKYFAQLSRLFVSWLSFNILSSFLLLLTSHPIYSRLIATPKLANHSQLFMIFFTDQETPLCLSKIQSNVQVISNGSLPTKLSVFFLFAE